MHQLLMKQAAGSRRAAEVTHLITLPRVVRLRLMAVPSLSLSASDPASRWRSLPARSTRFTLACLVMFSLEKICRSRFRAVVRSSNPFYITGLRYLHLLELEDDEHV